MRYSISIILVVTGLAQTAGAQVVGRIVGTGATRIPVAVSPLEVESGSEELGTRFAEILARNLKLSGYFDLLARDTFVEGPSPVDLDQINFGSWSVIGARALVKGTMRPAGSGIEVEAKMFDVAQRAQLGGNRYRGGPEELPRMARRFADSVLRMITGEAGPFDSRIAFVSRRGGRSKEIWTMSVDGFDKRQVTKNGTINLAPAWDPGGAGLVFTSYQDGNPSLYQVGLGGGPDRRLSAVKGLNLGADWSPDGRILVLSIEQNGNADIYLLDQKGTLIKRLTDHREIDVSPAWSPDGQKIVFVSSRAGGPQLYVMNADGTGQRRLTFQGTYNVSPSWSPKGDRIAYVTREKGFNVMTIDVSTGDVRAVTRGQGNNEDPSFSPDGRYLVFSSTRVGRPVLVLSDLTGEHQLQLTESGGDDSSPAWSRRLP